MSLLKKRGELVRIPEVLGRHWVPGYSYTTTEEVKTYVHGSSGGSGSGGSGSGGDRYVKFDHGLGSDYFSGDDFSGIVDY